MREKAQMIIINIFALFLIIMWLTAFAIAVIKVTKTQINKDEQIKNLEQSLSEQIKEKEVYMRMLELKVEE